MKRARIIIFCLCVLCLTLNGCALLQIPGAIINGTVGLLGQILKTAGKLPVPPPWLFL